MEEDEDLEEIHRLVTTAENTQDYLLHDAERYSRQLDHFYHTEEGRCKLDDGHTVSKRMMLDESWNLIRTIDYHEEMLSELREKRERVPDTADFRVIGRPGERAGNYEERIDKLVANYTEMFDSVMEVCSRAVRDPDLPDPIMMRSIQRTNTEFDGTGLETVLN